MLVIGGGGHALVSIEVLRACGLDIAGCLTRDGVASAGLDRIGVQVVGIDGDLATLVAGGHRFAFVAVGDNRARRTLSQAVARGGWVTGARRQPGRRGLRSRLTSTTASS